MASDPSNAARVAGLVSESVSNALSSSAPSAMSAMPAAAAHESYSWLGLFGWLIWSIFHIVSTILYWVIRIATINFPSFLYHLFSTSWTVTMNATTLMFIMAGLVSAVSWVVRYRILNMYSRLPPEPQRKEPEIDLFPDTHEGGTKSGLANYLDEFLSAIKIFGYLERPVFHELTRSMQTRKLIAGETINLEEEKGFCIVVDGLVEIFVKSGRSPRAAAASRGRLDLDSSDEDDVPPGQQTYQLLTEVRNGAPMSSLFSIMSLFTEDVRLRPNDDDDDVHPTKSSGLRHPSFPKENVSRVPSDAHISIPSSPQEDDMDSEAKKHSGRGTPNLDNIVNARIPPMSLDGSTPPPPPPGRPPMPTRATSSSAHPDIIARATVDTTIAIIPASAFRRLIKIYPKATSHIVHVILSRFQRVTLSQAFNYLGLTSEVLQTEKSMIKYTMCQLPNILRGDALERLKEKFNRERERTGEGEETKGIALHNSAATRRRRSSTTLRKEAVLQSMTKQRPASVIASNIAPLRERASPHTPSPGDLLANIQLARGGGRFPPDQRSVSGASMRRQGTNPLDDRFFNDPFDSRRHARMAIDPRESVDEDNLFRASILECMFKSLGLDSNASASREPESMEGSPRLVSLDQRRSKNLYSHNNAFGFMGPYDGSADGETESVTSSGMALHTPVNAQVLAHDMRDEVEIVFFPKGSVLVEQGERNPGLYYVVDGFLDIGTTSDDDPHNILQSNGIGSLQPDPSSPDPSEMGSFPNLAKTEAARERVESQSQTPAKHRRSVALVKPGGLAGYIGSVSSYRSFIDVVAKTDVYVGFLPRASLERIVDRYPIVLLTMAKRLTNILPRLILHIDFALEWVQVNAGQVLFHEGDESEAIYIALNGRLRLVQDRKGGGVNALAEFGQGDSVGELEVLTETARPGTLHAIRDTELVKFPRTLFNSLAQEHPNITIKISKIIASRMRAVMNDTAKFSNKDAGAGPNTFMRKSTMNLRTVAILPVTAGVPVVEFGNRLMNALAQVGPANGATSLNYAAILNHLGKHAFNKMGKLKLSQYLADLEEKYGLVVYVADTNVNSPWTQTCITQADSILLVGLAEGSPAIGEYERFMLGMKSTARKLLVLLHAERYSRPGLTRSWLQNRMWINGGHYHIQMAFRTNEMPVHPPSKRLGQALKERVQVLQAEIQKYTSRKVHHTPYYSPDTTFKGDFHRLARRLCGKSIGLVLGGGGARGITQIGIIRAMEEAGIPIDLVGGTSIGAFVGALYARHADVVPMFGFAKKFAGRMASLWRFALDLTYPSASYTTGHEFNRGIFKAFGDTQIEDFWLEYYCNTTNISKSRAEFHTSGYAWRYIRASMSLAGLLPPLCDEGSMLLDGGYVDNLTVSHMKGLGVDIIFAIDVGALDDDTPQTYGDSLSGAWAFVNRWNPFSSHPNPPTLAEIQARLAYVSSVDALERAKAMAGCIYMRPPIDDYGTLDFHKFDELSSLGYKYGQEFLQKMRDQGVLPLVEETEAKKALRRTMAPRRASI
ncbi:Lysophospholipase NTE1 [Fusarium falciforme]|uniref:Lysophospholipase NTE1 n=1 Tax=Fusarium falciforme TaxID=195108 RepID=UPI002301C923|nr:Lysophospholipase NTE1 [Fusarium falciforme]WAO95146.1 Lysophospholipase NTE1 [Fusarium falciforme]